MCGDVNWMNYIKYNFENAQVVEGQPGQWSLVKELCCVCGTKPLQVRHFVLVLRGLAVLTLALLRGFLVRFGVGF